MNLTTEQAEAWRISRVFLYEQAVGYEEMDRLLAAYDREQKTCGIEPNSFDHGLLMIANHVGLNEFHINKPTLRKFLDDSGRLNDRGREVLAALNAMCKGEK